MNIEFQQAMHRF